MKRNMSLRLRLCMVYVGVMGAIIFIFCVMNFFFWNNYYIFSNQDAMVECYETLSKMISDPNTTDEELTDFAISARNGQNIIVAMQGNVDWEFNLIAQQTVSEYERDFLTIRLQADFLNRNTDIVKVLKQDENYVLQRVKISETGDEYLECYGYMTNSQNVSKKFILSQALENIYHGMGISNLFFLYTALGVLLIGGLILNLITFKVTKPIYQLTELSKKMSHMDFSARYMGKSRDEIGVLGNNMNELASQLERNILRLQMANDKLQKDIEEKNSVDEMRKDFISNVSHELKTPIALIQGYAEGLKELGPEDKESMDFYVEVITDEADKMNRMVKKLLTLNQIEFGKDGLEMEEFDIMEMIHELASNSHKMQADASASVTVEGPDQCLVVGDEFKIEEVLNNYFSNALNHLAGERKIRIFLDEVGPKVRISVFNTGENIPEEDIDKVWVKFYKVDKARTRAYGGSGIGLSIVKAIMDAHKEECGVYNVPEGVIFWFELKKSGDEQK